MADQTIWPCRDQEIAFKTAFETVQAGLEAELAKIAKDAEADADEVFEDFESDRDLAEGVGAAAGTVLGGALGGPAGAAAGVALGKTIGGLFTIEVSYTEERISTDIPSVTMKNEEWQFHVPAVTMKDSDIIFHLPSMTMERRAGPKIPHTKTKMVTKCTGGGTGPFGIKYPKVCVDVPEIYTWWEQTYIDVPVWKNVEHRIVVGVPKVEMKEQRIVVGVPEIRMMRQDVIFRIPSITIRFIKDAGKRAASAASAIAARADQAATQKRSSLKQRIVLEVVEPAKDMFRCYRTSIEANRSRVLGFYDPEIGKLTNGLKDLRAKGVPETDDDYVAHKRQLDDVLLKRTEAESSFAKALLDLEKAEEKAIEGLLAS